MSKELNLRTWDIETTNWNEFKIGCIYDGQNSFYCYTIDEIIRSMIRLGGVFYAHFSGGFDNLFLLDKLKSFDVRTQNIGSRLVKISVYYNNSKRKLFELRDSYPILPQGLDSLREDFDVPISIPIKRWESYKRRRKQIEKFKKHELEEYVLVDTVVLYDILQIALEVFDRTDFKLTIASETKARWREMFDEKKVWLPSKLDAYFRKSYSGGRVEVFERFGENLNHYDYKSMYPAVMKNKLYPSGLAIYTATYKKDCLGIYTCEVEAPKGLHIPFLHTYLKNGKLVFPLGKWEGTYTSVEIDKALELGYKIKILCGYYFTKTCEPFKDYVNHFYKMKNDAEKEGKKAVRQIAKLYLNSLYGKLGQKRTFRKVVPIKGTLADMMKKFKVVDVIEELGLIVIEDECKRPYTTVHIASFVTAYARIKLYEAFEKVKEKGGKVYYCDTDCVVTDSTLETKKELGFLDLEEGNIKRAYFLFPKFYAYETSDGREVVRTKGIKKDLGVNDFKLCFDCETYEMFDCVQEGLAGILEGHRRKVHHLDVIKRPKRITGVFDKRIIHDDKIGTSPLLIS